MWQKKWRRSAKDEWGIEVWRGSQSLRISVSIEYRIVRVISTYMWLHGVPLLGKSVKTHLYWAMKNCGTSPDTLRRLITNIPEHYKVWYDLSVWIHYTVYTIALNTTLLIDMYATYRESILVVTHPRHAAVLAMVLVRFHSLVHELRSSYLRHWRLLTSIMMQTHSAE